MVMGLNTITVFGLTMLGASAIIKTLDAMGHRELSEAVTVVSMIVGFSFITLSLLKVINEVKTVFNLY